MKQQEKNVDYVIWAIVIMGIIAAGLGYWEGNIAESILGVTVELAAIAFRITG